MILEISYIKLNGWESQTDSGIFIPQVTNCIDLPNISDCEKIGYGLHNCAYLHDRIVISQFTTTSSGRFIRPRKYLIDISCLDDIIKSDKRLSKNHSILSIVGSRL